MSSKSRVDESGDASYTIFGGSLLLGVVGAHGCYVISAYAAIHKLKLDNPGRDIQVRINYLNLAHTEVLIYGLVAGLILGAVGEVAWKYLSRYRRSAAAKRDQESLFPSIGQIERLASGNTGEGNGDRSNIPSKRQ